MLIFTDLDDTLMKTTRKMGSLDSCIVGALDVDLKPSSYIDPSRQKLITTLLENNIVIPVTARSFGAMSRIQLAFKNEKIINFGATILNSDNTINNQWHNSMLNEFETKQYFEAITLLKDSLAKNLQAHYNVIERIENDLFIFLNLRNTKLDLEENCILADNLQQFFKLTDLSELFYIYVTDRDVTIIPSFIKKENAVKFIKNSYNMPCIGMGDHLNDLPFMELCDFTLFPNDSLISQQLYQ